MGFARKLAGVFGRAVSELLGTLVLLPLACIVPKKRGLVVFIGQRDGAFVDNVKYLYLHVHTRKPERVEYWYIVNRAKHPNTFELLLQNGMPVRSGRSLIGFWTLLRAQVACVDHTNWIGSPYFYLLARSRKVQLWHGSGIKNIEKLNPRRSGSIWSRARERVFWPLLRYDVVLMNSEFQLARRAEAFESRSFMVCTHPRTDALFREPDALSLIGADVDAIRAVAALKSKGRRIVLYAPTLRRRVQPAEAALDIDMLKSFTQEGDFAWVLKSHSGTAARFPKGNEDTIIHYDAAGDVYPLLAYVDVLITDYSSLFTDFLLLDRPICFYVYDLDEYTKKERAFRFDFEQAAPGPIIRDLEGVLRWLRELDDRADPYAEARGSARRAHFAHHDGGASARVWNNLMERYFSK